MELNEFQQEWVNELRNGGHAQGKGQLANASYGYNRELVGWEYCCLGVAACKVFGFNPTVYGHMGIIGGELEGGAEALGLDTEDQDQLAILNDYYNLSFDQIADVIEQMVAYGEGPTVAARNLGYITAENDT